MTRARGGFSLIELLVAMSLSSFVMLAIVGVATSMIRSHMDGLRKSTVTGGSVLSFVMMSREIESGNVLVYPGGGNNNTDLLVACNNWSRILPGAGGAPFIVGAPTDVIYYCYNPATKIIWRYFQSGIGMPCPPTPPPAPACDGLALGGGQMMATNVERSGGAQIFTRINSFGGVRIRYVVGEQTATASRPVPIFIPYDVSLTMQKAYGNAAD